MPIWIPEIWISDPGAGLNAPPFEAEINLDLTAPPGEITGLYYSLLFQLGKWGFERLKIEDWIEVSPVFKQYYDLTIQQRQALEAQIKAGLASIAQAVSDFELVFHDLRKYKEFLDYITWIEEGRRLIKEGKKEGEELKKKGEQTLKAIFIDQVDVHTGEGIAMKLIAPRWPTIIADFMQLDDEDTDPKKIKDKMKVSEPEGVILATKNKLYQEWRDRLFKETVKQRYQQILQLTEARRESIKQYRNMLKPTLTRYRMITEVLESRGGRASFARDTFFKPEAQAYSFDFARFWCWKPFSPIEKYKATREFMSEVSAKEAGFKRSEIEIIKMAIEKEPYIGTDPDKELFLKGRLYSLPIEPSIDKEVVRKYIPDIEKQYGVKLTPVDIFAARTKLVDQFLRHAPEARYIDITQPTGRREVLPGAPWIFSPYFIFLDIPFLRVMIRLPNGAEMENVTMENFRYYTQTQNVIILHLLEAIAREKQLENYISQMLGEMGVKNLESMEEMSVREYPEIFIPETQYKIVEIKEKDKIKKMSEDEKRQYILKKIQERKDKIKRMQEEEERTGKIMEISKKIKHSIGDILDSVGIKIGWLRARGPYEFAMYDRITKIFQIETGGMAMGQVVGFIKSKAGVPGIRW